MGYFLPTPFQARISLLPHQRLTQLVEQKLSHMIEQKVTVEVARQVDTMLVLLILLAVTPMLNGLILHILETSHNAIHR